MESLPIVFSYLVAILTHIDSSKLYNEMSKAFRIYVTRVNIFLSDQSVTSENHAGSKEMFKDQMDQNV